MSTPAELTERARRNPNRAQWNRTFKPDRRTNVDAETGLTHAELADAQQQMRADMYARMHARAAAAPEPHQEGH